MAPRLSVYSAVTVELSELTDQVKAYISDDPGSTKLTASPPIVSTAFPLVMLKVRLDRPSSPASKLIVVLPVSSSVKTRFAASPSLSVLILGPSSKKLIASARSRLSVAVSPSLSVTTACR